MFTSSAQVHLVDRHCNTSLLLHNGLQLSSNIVSPRSPCKQIQHLERTSSRWETNEDARGEDANAHPVVPLLPEPGEEPVPTATEDVPRGVVNIGEDEARGKAELECDEREDDEGHSATKSDVS